jgi:hypothetical protein
MNTMSRDASRFEWLPHAVLVLAWLATRVALYYAYAPVTYADSGTYLRLAHEIMRWDFAGYDGQRTPGYPLLLALVATNVQWLWVVQSLLALLTAFLVYALLRRAGVAAGWSLAAAVVDLSILNSMFFEPAVMTETLTAFLLVAVCYLVGGLVTGKARAGTPWLLGLSTALLTLTRSQYVVLIPVFALILWWLMREGKSRAILAFVIAASAPVLAWAAFNKSQTGEFTVTTLLGYNLTNHSGAFMELAPDRDAVLRDIYLKYRDANVAETGTHAMTIFRARRELLQATGLSEIGLAKEFQRISVELFAAHPLKYAASVAAAWMSYWTVPNYWQVDKIRGASLAAVLKGVWSVQHWLLRALNAALILLLPLVLWRTLKDRRSLSDGMRIAVLIAASVGSVSVIQALAEYGENGRYFIPSEPLVLVFAACILAGAARPWREERAQASRAVAAEARTRAVEALK